MKEFDLYDEKQYTPIPENSYTRPAQIPIYASRFRQLTEESKTKLQYDNWIMFHHPGHFLIYDKMSKCCAFDVAYVVFKEKTQTQSGEDSLVAVIPEIRINQDDSIHKTDEDDFGIVVELIENLH